MLYKELLEIEEFQRYLKVSRRRYIFAICFILFLGIMFVVGDGIFVSFMGGIPLIIGLIPVFFILAGMFALIYFMYKKSSKKPMVTFKGVVIDKREVTKRDIENDRTYTITQYLVSNGPFSAWAQTPVDFTRMKKSYKINDEVYYFSYFPMETNCGFIVS